jgi:uncharacterized membrane protein
MGGLGRENVPVDLTVNLGAIPFAVVAILFGTLQFVFRERWWTKLQQRRWDDPRRSSSKLRDRYPVFLAGWSVALAGFALFYDFD